MIRSIAATSINNIIGINNTIPWYYPEDLKHFKEITKNSIVIMGRKTWNSLPNKFKPLPNRINIVITSSNLDNEKNIHIFNSIDKCIIFCKKEYHSMDINFIGGYAIYKEAMQYVQEIHLTQIPLFIEINNKTPIYFPPIDEIIFNKKIIIKLFKNSTLEKEIYTRDISTHIHI